MNIQPGDTTRVEDLERLTAFRRDFVGCLTRRADALFEACEAVLCAGGPVTSLAGLSTELVFHRGHGALYDALACGSIDQVALGRLLADSWVPTDTGPVKVGIDVSVWDRPDAETSPQRCHCYHSCRCDGARKTIPGWPFSFAAGIEWGTTSWTIPLDAVRLGPDDDATLITVEQITRVRETLDHAGHLARRPAPVFVFDAGYDLTRISYQMGAQGLDVQILGRIRADRVYYAAPAPAHASSVGRPSRHGNRFELADPATHPVPDDALIGHNLRYGKVQVSAWHGLHQKLSRQGGWAQHTGQLPVVTGTLIRIQVEHLPGAGGTRTPKDLWLWHTAPEGTIFDLDLLWKTYLRRFDLEHTFRFFKQQLGWRTPQIRTTEQGERWTWLILTAYTQLRLGASLTQDLRRPWERPLPPDRPATPGRVRRGFANLVRKLPATTRMPKPSRPGPGRPLGTSRPPRPRYPVGRNQTKPDTAKSATTTPTG